MAGKLCVFSTVHNVYAADLAFLRTPRMHGTHTMLDWITNLWNRLKGVNGTCPPQGWPILVITFFILGCITAHKVWQGYKRIQKCEKKSNKLMMLQTSKEMMNGQACSFDSDTDLIIIDKSANCIVWKHKGSYIPETY